MKIVVLTQTKQLDSVQLLHFSESVQKMVDGKHPEAILADMLLNLIDSTIEVKRFYYRSIEAMLADIENDLNITSRTLRDYQKKQSRNKVRFKNFIIEIINPKSMNDLPKQIFI